MTALQNFEAPTGVIAKTEAPAKVQIAETVEVVAKPNEHHSYAAKADDAAWGWEELRDYVVDQIEQRTGQFPRDSKKEFGIFNRFSKEWGADAVAIARYAFEVCDGRWAGAPISITRFCKGSDPFFAQPILQTLQAVR